MRFLSFRVCLLVWFGLPSLVPGQDLRPDPNWKGTVTEGLLMPSTWAAYWPTAKVGDFVVQQDRWGNRRDEVVEITKDTIVVARVLENGLLGKGKGSELRFKYKVQLEKPKNTPPKGTGKASSNSKSKSSNSSKNKSSNSSKKNDETEMIKVGDQEIECTVAKLGTITRWYSPLLPFDGMVKQDAPDAKFVVVSFGRGK